MSCPPKSTEVQLRNGGARADPIDGALLIAFNDLHFDVKISGDCLYESLVPNGVWLTPRLPKQCKIGMTVIFYQAGIGFRGIAKLEDVGKAVSADWRLPGSGFCLFPVRLTLTDVRTFSKPVGLKGLAQELQCVSNKQRYGQAVQFTPRIIPICDLDLIVAAALEG